MRVDDMSSLVRELHKLARLSAVQTAYVDVSDRRQSVSPDTLVDVLKALGAPIERLEDAPEAARVVMQERWRQPLEPVVVIWEGNHPEIRIRLPLNQAGQAIRCRIELEDGGVHRWSVEAESLRMAHRISVEGLDYVETQLRLERKLPFGYHAFFAQVGKVTHQSLIVSAPKRAFTGHDKARRTWGLFIPTYALQSERSWGAGDLGDLERLLDWVYELGGATVGTLPMLASYLDEPFDPSPYAPVSRLFWNEFFIDLDRVLEMGSPSDVSALRRTARFKRTISELRKKPLVDYRRQMALKREVLERLSDHFFALPSERRFPEFQRFVREHPAVEDYARFRAATELRKSVWVEWPAAHRDGTLDQGDYDAKSRDYHLYVQFLADQQFRSLADRAGESGYGLYLDLPLGVHSAGYDVWRMRHLFVADLTGGAPSDVFFSKGQNWGFPPLHPRRIREEGYRYVIDMMRHQMRVAGILRIDHIMGFHRLYCIPKGREAREGTYVRYPAEEFYAIAILESHRNQTLLVGEDLGTVPREVRRAMGRHAFRRSYVVQYELQPDSARPLRDPPAKAVATVNTHDMPTFYAFWRDLDIVDRLEMEWLDRNGAITERRMRGHLKEALIHTLGRGGWISGAGDERDVIEGILGYLSAGRVQMILVNLEDLWLEREAQNVPGTGLERPNWTRKARYSLEDIMSMPGVVSILRRIQQYREKKPHDEQSKE